MRNVTIFATAVAFVFCLTVTDNSSTARADKGSGPGDMILQTGNAKSPAKFPHKKHQEKYDCATCHHKQDATGARVSYSAEDNIQKCITCHNEKMDNKSLNTLKLAAHALCKECHKKDGGPNKCPECHVK
ncbi:MAG: hypothetical protein A2521_11430 [Deltaproteobacteria bacterium RIFOXYD12_FULL_57_12]|nr:MAG: hypothetical protein A2521_11430 [Deltaproteobacteria bacterium RIFOXYD12_FULL_57_12]